MTQEHLNSAVLYALKCGCFFPVPEPKPTADVEAWIRWGAMRHLHDAIANHFREPGGASAPRQP